MTWILIGFSAFLFGVLLYGSPVGALIVISYFALMAVLFKIAEKLTSEKQELVMKIMRFVSLPSLIIAGMQLVRNPNISLLIVGVLLSYQFIKNEIETTPL